MLGQKCLKWFSKQGDTKAHFSQLNTVVATSLNLAIKSLLDKIPPPDNSRLWTPISWHFSYSCEISWHFQVFQISGHPEYRFCDNKLPLHANCQFQNWSGAAQKGLPVSKQSSTPCPVKSIPFNICSNFPKFWHLNNDLGWVPTLIVR